MTRCDGMTSRRVGGRVEFHRSLNFDSLSFVSFLNRLRSAFSLRLSRDRILGVAALKRTLGLLRRLRWFFSGRGLWEYRNRKCFMPSEVSVA